MYGEQRKFGRTFELLPWASHKSGGDFWLGQGILDLGGKHLHSESVLRRRYERVILGRIDL